MSTYIFLILALTNVLLVQGQDCGFIGTNETYFELPEATERTAEGEIIWEHDIYNVVRSTAINTPHFPYLTGLRYQTFYQYKASDIFSQFPDTIRTQYLERNVTFYCEDDGTQNYYFRLRIKDENTQPPIFNNVEYTVNALTPWDLELPINSATIIIVSDADFEPENAEIHINISNPNFNATITSLNPDPYPEEYYYMVNIYYANENVAPNVYRTILTADDGINSVFVPLEIRVTATG